MGFKLAVPDQILMDGKPITPAMRTWMELVTRLLTGGAVGINGITVEDEGTPVGTAAGITTIDFVGSSVTATGTGADATITVAAGGIEVQDEGVQVVASATTLDFRGEGVAASDFGGGVALIQVPGPYVVSSMFNGTIPASTVVLRHVVTADVFFEDDFSGSEGVSEDPAAASTDFDITVNGVSVGTMTYAMGASTAGFVTSGAGTLQLFDGDILRVIAPASPDATLAGISFSLRGTR